MIPFEIIAGAFADAYGTDPDVDGTEYWEVGADLAVKRLHEAGVLSDALTREHADMAGARRQAERERDRYRVMCSGLTAEVSSLREEVRRLREAQ